MHPPHSKNRTPPFKKSHAIQIEKNQDTQTVENQAQQRTIATPANATMVNHEPPW